MRVLFILFSRRNNYRQFKNKNFIDFQTWKQTIIFAVVTGVLTGILAQIPILYNTSFADITVTFEWWILFAMLIVIGQDTWRKAGFKTLVFFLISQTVVFLAEWPIAGEFYFPYWVRWIEISFLTLPAG